MPRLSTAINALIGLGLVSAAAACTWQGLRPDSTGPRRLYITGELQHVPDTQIVKTARPYLEANFFDLDIGGLRKAVAALPWVAAVQVRRRWPDGVVVAVNEHRPVALWGDSGVLAADGKVFQLAASQRPDDLPVVSGPADSRDNLIKALPGFNKLLAALPARIARLSIDSRGSWTVVTADGLQLRLGRVDIAARLRRFVTHAAAALGPRLNTIGYVDLRYADGFAVGGNREKSTAAS